MALDLSATLSPGILSGDCILIPTPTEAGLSISLLCRCNACHGHASRLGHGKLLTATVLQLSAIYLIKAVEPIHGQEGERMVSWLCRSKATPQPHSELLLSASIEQ